MIFDIHSFKKEIKAEGTKGDTLLETVSRGEQLELYVTAMEDKPQFIELNWQFAENRDYYVLGDAWERSYGELTFRKLSELNRYLPWYFFATDKETSFGFGVKTQPNAFISFQYTAQGIRALVDCRNGSQGVELKGRKLHLATFVYKQYDSSDIYACLQDYCKTLCDNPILTRERVYGGNNWYYAYGNSSYKEILSDAAFQAELAQGLENRPFEVIDDCWQINRCEGPWIANEKFGDMKKLAEDIKALGVRPGIWVRLLHNRDTALTEDMRIYRDGKRQYLDPTHPAVQAYIRSDIDRIKGWGYDLLKHDFTTYDLFGSWGKDLDATITRAEDWHFYDRTKTNAEIVLDLYRLIREAAGDMYIIGCNTVSHLCAGLVEINRTGDDTSGRDFERTREMGINTLAFRLAQNEAFYMCDADCVGILEDCIPWEKNGQWLHLLAHSNTPLFVSCTNRVTPEQKKDLQTAYRVYQTEHTFRPLDIYENPTPSKWEIDSSIQEYCW